MTVITGSTAPVVVIVRTTAPRVASAVTYRTGSARPSHHQHAPTAAASATTTIAPRRTLASRQRIPPSLAGTIGPGRGRSSGRDTTRLISLLRAELGSRLVPSPAPPRIPPGRRLDAPGPPCP